MKNEIVDYNGRKALKLTNAYAVKRRGRPAIDVTYTALCEPNRYLTPLTVKSEGTTYEESKGRVDLRFEDGKLLGRYWLGEDKPEEVTANLPKPVVIDLALPRVATLMPLAKGAELRFHYLPTDGFVEKDHVLRCLGVEELRIATKLYKAWKFEHPLNEFDSQHFWVSEQRVILKSAGPSPQFFPTLEIYP